ncbi:hypothetical protein GCM10011414_03920 [Croceivirga lutea]|uniref:hypothetical protein n=1 Tax=Croceivirga lutea TaxID=1775167 RepID=UPI00163A6F31|nr:hypothetical protein [Croceivirga lutea]GGG37770.1 hypothetical protein GCM10011414_03920 [Croceivirga lutea]
MQHSILLSEESTQVTRVDIGALQRQKETQLPKWINANSLLSVSIVSFCVMLALIGLPIWIAAIIAGAAIGFQVYTYIKSGFVITLNLNGEELSDAIEKDLNL